MANGPQDYRDPKVTTTTTQSSSMKWLWYALGALLVLLLLGWLLGLFSGNDDEAAVTADPAATEEVVVTEEPAATEEVVLTEEPATDAATGSVPDAVATDAVPEAPAN